MNIKTSTNLAILIAEIVSDLNIIVPVAPHDHPEKADLPCVSIGDILIWSLEVDGSTRKGDSNNLVWYADLKVVVRGQEYMAPLEPIFTGGTVLQAITAGMKYLLSQRLNESILKLSKHFPKETN